MVCVAPKEVLIKSLSESISTAITFFAPLLFAMAHAITPNMPVPAIKIFFPSIFSAIRMAPAAVATAQLIMVRTGNGIFTSGLMIGVWGLKIMYSLSPPCK